MNKYFFINSYLAPDLVQHIVEVGEKHEYQQALVINADGTVALDDKRKCKVISIDTYTEPMLVSQLFLIGSKINLNFQFDITAIREMTLTKYEAGDEYDWHQDVSWKEYPSHRKLTMVVQLSDPNDYDGGDLNLMDCEISEKQAKAMRNKGTVIVFPSILRHKITPITRGTRKSLVSWIEGPTWR